MGWYEDYPEWSRQVHDLARKLAVFDGKDPDQPVNPMTGLAVERFATPYGDFTQTDVRLSDAADIIGPPAAYLPKGTKPAGH